MRIITGTARGRKLREPEGRDVRPTTDMVKEAMFSMCQFDIEGRDVLDLFGGTGQLGIEAASRGAARVDIVDSSRDSLRLIRENVGICGVDCRVVESDSLGYLKRCGKYHLIFIDPPYDTELVSESLALIKEFDILGEGGIIICETRKEKALPELEKPYFRKKERCYGKIKLTVYSKESSL